MAVQTQQPNPPAEYHAKRYERLIGTPGMSDQMLRTHFELYEGYVKHTNKALALLRDGGLDAFAQGEVRRRLGWEWNGMRMHELYFDGMVSGGRELARESQLRKAILAQWGGSDKWWDSFAAIGRERGIGWAALYWDNAGSRLLNTWVSEHDTGHLTTCQPILVLDLWEHAYMQDYGTDRDAYMQAFAGAIDWDVCRTRFREAHRPAGVAAGAA